MKKTISIGLALTGSMLAIQSLATTSAMAATTYSYYNTNIELNGTVVSSPKHIVSNGTSFVPVWYVDNALTSVGITGQWNGTTLNFVIPSSFNVDLSNLPAGQTLNSSNMAIAINGTVVGYAPKIVYTDPSSGQLTTYASVYYLEQAVKRLGITPGWDGTNWTMTYSTSSTTPPTTSNGGGSSNTVDQQVMANAMWNVLNTDNKPGVNTHATIAQAGISPSATTPATANDVASYLASWAESSLGYDNQNTGEFVPFSLQYESSSDAYTWANNNSLFQGTTVKSSSSVLTPSDETQIINNLKWWMNGYKTVSGGYQVHDLLESHYAEYFGIVPQSGESESQYQQSMADAEHYMDQVTFSGTAKGGTIKVTLPSTKSSGTETCYQVIDGSYWYGWFGNDTVSQSQGGTTLSVPNSGGALEIHAVSGKYNLIGTSLNIPNTSTGLNLTQIDDLGIPGAK
ncbi:YbaB/EbfC family nucleoid-associated protein [Alicyclobacillus fodiniaquatilis]|uniref:YbaB/EbfC family nucleoid-associated protein n=1 Tax=Alicyclobacillus fodiniaquatilis TaxID=1661150 RepID=A0ABW4JEV8_9BACL